MKKLLCRSIAVSLIVSLSHLGWMQSAQAAMVGTEATLATPSERSTGLQRIEAFFDRADVAAQLQRMGLTADEAKARAAGLSDAEIAEAANRLDTLPAGGDAFGTIIGAAVLIFIVLLITDILGLTKVFSFTKPVKR